MKITEQADLRERIEKAVADHSAKVYQKIIKDRGPIRVRRPRDEDTDRPTKTKTYLSAIMSDKRILSLAGVAIDAAAEKADNWRGK